MPRFRLPTFGRSFRVNPSDGGENCQLLSASSEQGSELKLVRCAACRSPLVRMAPGSSAAVKCRHCGALVRVELRSAE